MVNTCRVCFVTHDEEIHAATLSVRRWFRENVLLSIQPPKRFMSGGDQAQQTDAAVDSRTKASAKKPRKAKITDGFVR